MNTYPLIELIDEQSKFHLRKAMRRIRKADANFRRVINNVLVTEDEYYDWLSRGGASSDR